MLGGLLIVGVLVYLIFKIWIYPSQIQYKRLQSIPGPTPGLLGNLVELGSDESMIQVLMIDDVVLF